MRERQTAKKEENKHPSERDAIESVDVKSFYGFRKEWANSEQK